LRQAQKLESVGRLAAGVAHDFNNLLTVINGYSRLLLGSLKADDPLRGGLEEIHKAGERAAALIQQLLAFSRKQILQPRVLDLNRVVDKMRPMLERLMGEDVEVCVQSQAEAATICADPNQLEQVLMNLAVNSRDAMPDGGKFSIGTGFVEWDESQARLHPGAHAGPYVMLAVSDTGEGMSEETRGHIFEPFFTTKEVGKGTGLGLSTIHGIVEQSGGCVEVASEPGRGATFKIYMPRVVDAPAESGSPEAVPEMGGQETVLVVEDQAEVREYAAAALRAYGYQVMEAANAEEALLVCEREGERIRLILTDVVMPGLSGRELADRLKTLRPGIKVLFMSGHTDDSMVHHGVLQKEAGFIQKPFGPGQLAMKVREMLGAPDRPARIVVADDEAGVRSFLRLVLESAGYEVVEAPDGKLVLQEARAGRVDLVITDLVMPEQEGLETIRALRREVPGVGIIAISGALGPQFLEVARMLGAQAVLRKPLSAELLLAKVAEVLKSRR
jgi:CheY-like chemotaxis protein